MRPMKEVHSYIASKAVQLSVRVAWLWGILCREADAESSSRVQVEAKLGTCGDHFSHPKDSGIDV
jgi:hypothetical protein